VPLRAADSRIVSHKVFARGGGSDEAFDEASDEVSTLTYAAPVDTVGAAESALAADVAVAASPIGAVATIATLAYAASPVDTVRAADSALAAAVAVAASPVGAVAAIATPAVDEEGWKEDDDLEEKLEEELEDKLEEELQGEEDEEEQNEEEQNEEGELEEDMQGELQGEEGQQQRDEEGGEGERGEEELQEELQEELHEGLHEVEAGGLESDGVQGEGDGGPQGMEWSIKVNGIDMQVQLVLYTAAKGDKRSALAILDATNDPAELKSKYVKLCAWVDNVPEDLIGKILGSPNQACCALRDALGRETTRGSGGVNIKRWLCTNSDPNELPNLLGHAIQQGTLQGLIRGAKKKPRVRGPKRRLAEANHQLYEAQFESTEPF